MTAAPARPILYASSGVRSAFAPPRTPSVPKYFPIRRYFVFEVLEMKRARTRMRLGEICTSPISPPSAPVGVGRIIESNCLGLLGIGISTRTLVTLDRSAATPRVGVVG